ncbi:MAG: SURF1 family cytochrome oxidase biogenesis protein [Alphaproteobacteria bacterium]
MAAFAHLKNVVPAMVDLVGKQDVAHLPVPSDGSIKLRNDHLSYILTWYGIAAGILVIFLTYHWERPKK